MPAVLLPAPGPLHQPRPGEPETAMLPGMASARPQEPLHGVQPLAMPDTSIGPVALQEPAHWSYDFDPASGASRATYPGEVAGGGSLPTTGSGPFVLANGATMGSPNIVGADLITPTTFDGGTLSSTGIAFVAGAGVQGVANASNAAAGQVGEYLSATVLSGAAVPLTNNVAATVASLPLTAGDWDVSGGLAFVVSTGQATNVQAGIGTVPATMPAGPQGLVGIVGSGALLGTGTDLAIAAFRVSLAAASTVYLVGYIGFPTGTAAGYGFISARRAR